MTSRVSFYKIMVQDIRHRLWMVALSCLGSFLTMPVAYLLLLQNWQDRIERWSPEKGWDVDAYKISMMHNFFVEYLPILCCVILVAGAMIVGIWGFRHVYSKKMVDQYHSIPVKRRDLFLANYLNGFLIWLVPMVIGGLICVVLSGFFLGNFYNWMLHAVKPFLLLVPSLILCFLLIYHVTIVAVMLSGNILNTLVNGTIISFGPIALYGMFEVFKQMYFDTYYSFFESNILNIIWMCPFGGVVYQTYMFCSDEMRVFPIVMNILVALALFAAGYVLYLVRPSELAEQGMKMKPVQIVFKAVTTVLAGMCGWWFFENLTGRLPWMIFGAVLVSVLCYGILDIVFHMDFKAFFAHKISLCINVVAAVLVCFLFCFDWIGYDSYLPDEEDIADMGIYIGNFALSQSAGFEEEMLIENRIKRMSYKNQENIYNLLQAMVSNAEPSGAEVTEIVNKSDYYYGESSTEARVRITEKNGKTYYRAYRLYEHDEEVMLPILMDDSYIRNNMLVPQSTIDRVAEIMEYGQVEIENGIEAWNILYEGFLNEDNYYKTYENHFNMSPEAVAELLEAYNADILDNPKLYIYQQDDVVASLRLWSNHDKYVSVYCDIYQSMDRVRAVLEKYNLEEVLAKPSAEDVKSITLEIFVDKYSSYESAFEGAVTTAVVGYGVIDDKVTVESYGCYTAEFTETKDIEELLDVIILLSPNHRSLFRETYADGNAILNMRTGKSVYTSFRTGSLPQRFMDSLKYQEEY